MSARLTLPRARRIRRGGDFRRLKADGDRLASGSLVLNWGPCPPGQGPRLGVITSRSVGPAVDRNRARRLIREAFRHHQHELLRPVDLILIARQSIRTARLADVERHLLRGLRQARLVNPGPPPAP